FPSSPRCSRRWPVSRSIAPVGSTSARRTAGGCSPSRTAPGSASSPDRAWITPLGSPTSRRRSRRRRSEGEHRWRRRLRRPRRHSRRSTPRVDHLPERKGRPGAYPRSAVLEVVGGGAPRASVVLEKPPGHPIVVARRRAMEAAADAGCGAGGPVFEAAADGRAVGGGEVVLTAADGGGLAEGPVGHAAADAGEVRRRPYSDSRRSRLRALQRQRSLSRPPRRHRTNTSLRASAAQGRRRSPLNVGVERTVSVTLV